MLRCCIKSLTPIRVCIFILSLEICGCMLFLTAFCCVQMQGSISHLKLSFPHIVPPKIWLRTFELYFVSWPIQTQRHETNFSRHHRRLLVCERIWAIIIFRYKSKKIWNRRESLEIFLCTVPTKLKNCCGVCLCLLILYWLKFCPTTQTHHTCSFNSKSSPHHSNFSQTHVRLQILFWWGWVYQWNQLLPQSF